MVNGKAKVGSSVLVPYGAESSEESDEESKGLAKENGVDMKASTHSDRPEAAAEEDAEASPHELQEPVMLNGANSADSDSRENSLAFDSASCQVQTELHTENLFSKLNGLPGKVSGREGFSNLLAHTAGAQWAQSWQQELTYLCFVVGDACSFAVCSRRQNP